MLNFVQFQERRKFKSQEYIKYFEDYNLSLTQKLGKRKCFSEVLWGDGKSSSVQRLGIFYFKQPEHNYSEVKNNGYCQHYIKRDHKWY